MSKLYVFGIGGTGSRVLRALTMLLASGVKCEAQTIVPIIIDPDQSAADLTRTVNLMKAYSRVRSKLDFSEGTENQFFKTELYEQVNGYRLPLNSDTTSKKFKDYIQLGNMATENQALIRMLFSEQNLESDMQVGFKGNPNIGSVVLNQFQDSDEFQQFANGFQQDDKIFIISSIFGGTGASGFPLLLKTLRTDTHMPNNGLINNAVIGAISVLPYFSVQPNNNSAIDSTTFISKTKSALTYYERNISKNNAIDYLYYVADDINRPYDNNEGGSYQCNDAHLVELWAALSIIDFAKNAQHQKQTLHKEFGTDDAQEPMTFADLGNDTKQLISAPLTQMTLFANFMKEHCDESCEKQPCAKDHGLKSEFIHSDFVRKDLHCVQNEGKIGLIGWLDEMAGNVRAFAPFDWSNDDPLKRVRGKEIKYGLLQGKKSQGYAYFDGMLNEVSFNLPDQRTKEQRLVEIFYRATKKMINEKYKF